ncbi:(2Fe-2S)-binding protein [Alteribacillus bidgolensis]|uniref:BFD-like [2Fe-2S] binding domain-containing protein n=1 Tax=Alteribacillus bidgolensis TaxID=930129 RepID=A0A1G8JMF8_9BACI|nr:(2Fe-2S)-binding protein [Alteribacillus bidgolensis]SDI32356.1 BFD-like [2Fe-2S] binding domain-containing protein [Alteribacillus bidgolensis]
MIDETTIICRCEDIPLGTITDTAKQFHCSSREVKLRTRAGMGYCGGRTCRTMVERIVQEINNEKAKDESQLSYRPPIRPVTFGELGGENNNES